MPLDFTIHVPRPDAPFGGVLEREQQLSKELEVAKPMASKWDAYCNSEGLIGMTEIADIVGTNVRTLTAWLVKKDLFRRQTSRNGGNRNLPRKAYQDTGHFAVKTESKNGVVFPVAYATPQRGRPGGRLYGAHASNAHWGRRGRGISSRTVPAGR
ncbi:phage antirepressor KilAC domain-containing protein [Nonomuraea sp. CA-141351]|uniref:phage antirepressor KilAC domain-containing protein n=1 Tax=Nonomuraea sp. CA-141351 TaxID=3239996 RepID=UPI003D8C1198